jgi:hypothetical protein
MKIAQTLRVLIGSSARSTKLVIELVIFDEYFS